MAFRTLLVPVDANPSCDDRIVFAADLARAWSAGLIAVGAEPYRVDAAAGYGFVDAGVLEISRQEIEAGFARSEQHVRSLVGSIDAGLTWKAGIGEPSGIVAAQAGAADLIVTSRVPRGRPFQAAPAHHASPADLVMEGGVPVLVVPAHAHPLDARRIVVAWKDGREARRAVADALPLLVAAEQVVLLGVRPADAEDDAEQVLHNVQQRLLRHGVKVETRLEAPKGRVSATLLEAGARLGAGLLVAGAYGHSRLREWALGGVTQDLLDHADLPVFLSR